jgi:N-acyl-D-amino-acid deacylase
MTAPRKKMTRRDALAGLGGLAAVAQIGDLPGVAQAQQKPPPTFSDAIPIKGKAGPGLEVFDNAMLEIMDRHGIPGAALAIARNGKLILAKGYGWSNVATGEAATPETKFGLCSISKTITAVAVMKLLEQKKLTLDEPVMPYLKHIPPPRGMRVDPRLAAVTVRQCLNHSGGWDRNVRGDPLNWQPQICRAFQVPPPLSPPQFVSFAQTLPLDFDPGTDTKYSNVGYVLLGEVIAKVTGQPYERFVQKTVFEPMGIKRMTLNAFDGKYQAGEAVRHLAGTLTGLPAPLLPMVDAAGGWGGSVVDLVRFLTNLDGSRGESVLTEKSRQTMREPPPQPIKPRADGTWFGLGWDVVAVKDTQFACLKEGSYQGMRTFMRRMPTGTNWALLYNASMEFDPQDNQLAATTTQAARRYIEEFQKYPDVDLFGEYP